MNQTFRKLRPLAFLPAALWYGVIWRFSAQTAVASGELSDRLLYRLLEAWSFMFRNQTPEGKYAVVEFLSFYERKAAHMFLYFVLIALLLLALRLFLASPIRQAGIAAGLCTSLAALDEFHQTFVPGRSGHPRDVMVDLAGAACFLLLWWLIRRVWISYHPAPKAETM